MAQYETGHYVQVYVLDKEVSDPRQERGRFFLGQIVGIDSQGLTIVVGDDMQIVPFPLVDLYVRVLPKPGGPALDLYPIGSYVRIEQIDDRFENGLIIAIDALGVALSLDAGKSIGYFPMENILRIRISADERAKFDS